MMKALLPTIAAMATLCVATHAVAEAVFYEQERFGGRSLVAQKPIAHLDRFGFNNRASSIDVRGDRWEVCEGERFAGRCAVLRPGSYPSLSAMGLNNRIESARAVGRSARVDDLRYAPPPSVSYSYYKRSGETVYEAQVVAVRAVVGPPEQRCWVEREKVVVQRDEPNVGGAVAGAILGGILGHQIGSGGGRDVATAVGAVAGAAVGANVGAGRQVATQNVQRCREMPSQAKPDYFDVTYVFRGQEHRVQTTAPPGPTVTVNGRGEPRA
jgi:uncharacterized protein YcfJ